MGGIRKVSHPNRHSNFRRRLERALSLSPSDSESAQSPSRSAEGDTTEDESLQEEIRFSGLQRGTNLVNSIPQDAAEDWIEEDKLGEKLDVPKEEENMESRAMIAFQCIAELRHL
ncbi:hypothetical protein N7520_009689 [Penicillium odoratum]|uniref:uncharacterized protein n=1 Tax=Penicillium odoratum TaxID=1167516 RepID=UPI002548DDC1|nr:uncharacterized protein N7520_009689 [Penicillium odoratum]KAJ5752772.1 hypothetical protein N7520_009689 [Penicillium odoratum]